MLWQTGDLGHDVANPFRNTQAKYVLPTSDEWYKSTYYDPSANSGAGGFWDYATGSNTIPSAVSSGTTSGTAVYDGQAGPADITQAGGLSPLRTMGQEGNVWEWEETTGDLTNLSSLLERGVRGGRWSQQYYLFVVLVPGR